MNELQIVERSPKNEVAFGKQAATALMDIVREQKLARKFGGEKEHLYVEAWELLGQFAGLSAGSEAEPIAIDGIKGAKGKAIIRDKDGNIVGEAVALCMRDEPNWKNKPFFQLMSMAQTRAVSKAYRIRLGWIAVLAGYSGTPAEEMDGVHAAPTPVSGKKSSPPASPAATEDMCLEIEALAEQTGTPVVKILEAFKVKRIGDMTQEQANKTIDRLTQKKEAANLGAAID